MHLTRPVDQIDERPDFGDQCGFTRLVRTSSVASNEQLGGARRAHGCKDFLDGGRTIKSYDQDCGRFHID